MKKTTRTPWANLKVGSLLLLAIVVMLWASLSGGGTSIFNPKSSFICYFRNVNGLVSGSPVWMAGVEVGNVRSVQFVNLDSIRVVRVDCRIKNSVWKMMTTNSAVALGTIGFLGDKYVEVIPGTPGLPQIPKGAVVPTRDVGSAEAMFKAGETAIGEAKSVADNLDELLARMNQGKGTLGQLAANDKLYLELTKLTGNLSQLVADLQKNQERIVGSIEKTATAVDTLAVQVNNNTGTVGRLMNDPALYDNLAQTSARLDTLLARINSGKGTLGLLVNDTTMYVQIADLLARSNVLVKDMMDNPRKYFKFSVF